MSEYVQQKKAEMGSDSEEDDRSFVSYGESEEYNSDEEKEINQDMADLMDIDDDNDKQMKVKQEVVDDDGFTMTPTKKGRR